MKAHRPKNFLPVAQARVSQVWIAALVPDVREPLLLLQAMPLPVFLSLKVGSETSKVLFYFRARKSQPGKALGRAGHFSKGFSECCIVYEIFLDHPSYFFSPPPDAAAAAAAWTADFFTPTVLPFLPVVLVLCPRTLSPKLCLIPFQDKRFFSRSMSDFIVRSRSLPSLCKLLPLSESFLRFSIQ